MTNLVHSRKLKHSVPVALLFLSAAVILKIYSFGLTAPVLFDTAENLTKLDRPFNLVNALDFVFSGVAGPSGRPISLLSFLPQWSSWPGRTEDLVFANIGIHIVNLFLVAIVAFQLALLWTGKKSLAYWTALFTAILWASAPILASSTFMIIQRMTLLATFFALLGISFHLYLRHFSRFQSRYSIYLLTLNITLFTLLAGASKENGLILPILILVVELSLSPKNKLSSPPLPWQWKSIFLIVPAITIGAYLVYRSDYTVHTLNYRDFTSLERIYTQALILWQYLLNSAIPAARNLGPFHDDISIAEVALNSPAFLATLAWIALLFLSALKRHRHPVLFFSVFWFIAAHAIESTTIPLELYFEHRNYLPLIGPFIGLTAFVLTLAPRYRRLCLAGAVALFAANLLVLTQNAKIWGGPPIASAQFWQKYHPNSLRANQNLANQYVKQGDYHLSLALLDRNAEKSRFPAYQYLEQLFLLCQVDDETRVDIDQRYFKSEASTTPLSYGFISLLNNITAYLENSSCLKLDDQFLRELLLLLRNNPNYQGEKTQMHLNLLLGIIEKRNGSLEPAFLYLRESTESMLDSRAIFELIDLLISNDKGIEACAQISRLRSTLPSNPITAFIWNRRLDVYENDIHGFTNMRCS